MHTTSRYKLSFFILHLTTEVRLLNIHIPRAQVTETHHEALHEIHSREFHYFQKGTFPSFSRRDPAALSTVKENYCFGARYTGLQEPPKQIFQHKTFCPCASCISG